MERIFIPGSRWLFFKLYTGTQSADILLTRHIGPFVRRLCESGAIDDFFFIRYTDPLFHLRLRLHLPDTSRYGEGRKHCRNPRVRGGYSSLAWKAAS